MVKAVLTDEKIGLYFLLLFVVLLPAIAGVLRTKGKAAKPSGRSGIAERSRSAMQN